MPEQLQPIDLDSAPDLLRVVDEVAKSLRNQDRVNVARGRLLQLIEIVIGQRLVERNFYRGCGLIYIGDDANGHSRFQMRKLFWIGAAGENCKGTVELLSEHNTRKFVRIGHGAKR